MALPRILDTGFHIDRQKLWNCALPVEEILIDEIIHNIDIPYLESEGTDDWNLSIRELIQNFSQEFSHAKKVQNADLKYPIELYFHKDTWIILDGVHRLTKAILLWHKTILARRIPNDIIPSIQK